MKSIKSGSRKTIIHVNQHAIRANLKNGTTEPVITVKRGDTNTYCHRVLIQGPSQVVHDPRNPLACGARVWIETTAQVLVAGDVREEKADPSDRSGGD